MIVLITGTTGSGKSTLTKTIVEHSQGFRVFDHDETVRGLYEIPEIRKALLARIGSDDRKVISGLMLDVSRRLEILTSLRQVLAPGVLAAMKQASAAALRERADLILDFPAYFEMVDLFPEGDHIPVDLALCLSVDAALQDERLASRGVPTETREVLRSLHYSQEHKSLRCDATIAIQRGTDSAYTARNILSFVARAKEVSALVDEIVAMSGCAAGAISHLPVAKILAPYHFNDGFRGYHNVEHILDMLMGLKRFMASGGSVCDLPALIAAILGHDRVYRPASPTNEADSVKEMAAFIPKGIITNPFGIPQRTLVAEHILSTKEHTATAFPFFIQALREDNALLLDLDLAVFAQPWGRVLRFENGIRSEYSAFDDVTYLCGRIECLKGFSRRQIFKTAYFQKREDQAHMTIRRLSEKLEAQLKCLPIAFATGEHPAALTAPSGI